MENEHSPPPLGAAAAAEELVGSAQFQHLVQGFEKACGLKLYAYTATSTPLGVPLDPPAFCQTMQAGSDCPLNFDPAYHTVDAPELRPTCGGLGHAVIPVRAPDGTPLCTLVSETVRFGPVDMELITDKAFQLKVFPDDLAAQAESVPLVARERVLFAAQIIFAGMHELVGGQSARAGAISLIIRNVAGAGADEVPDAILAAALEFCEADYAYVNILGDEGELVAESGNMDTREPWYRILQGLAQWVVHAGETVDVADVTQSAWSRHLAGEDPPVGAIVGMPLTSNGTVYGGIVVGGANRNRLQEWTTALAVLTEAGGDALVLARRLIAAGDESMVDAPSGAYNLRFLEELLEKEISRAGRHHHHLSLVVFRLANYPEILSHLGSDRAQVILGQVVELIRSKTRKVNSLARVSETDFCLVIPEAAPDVAEKIGEELSALAQSADYITDINGGKRHIQVTLDTHTVANPSAVDAALASMVASLN